MSDKYYKESLKDLKNRKTVPPELLAELKSNNKIKSSLLKAISSEPKTVPEISEEIGVPSDKVLWLVSALRKYGQLIDQGKRGDYHLYIKSGESK